MKNLSSYDWEILKRIESLIIEKKQNKLNYPICLENIIADQNCFIFEPGLWIFNNNDNQLKIFCIKPIDKAKEQMILDKLKNVVLLFELMAKEGFYTSTEMAKDKYINKDKNQNYQLNIPEDLARELSKLWNIDFQFLLKFDLYINQKEKGECK